MRRPKQNASPRLVRAFLLLFIGGVGLLIALTAWKTNTTGREQPWSLFNHQGITVGIILTKSEALKGVDIAQMSIACASGLPGTERLDGQNAQAVLESWASRVGAETEKNIYKFYQEPGLFNH